MYWRFFVVTPGNPIWDAFLEDHLAREEARKVVYPFMQSVGAEYCYGHTPESYSFNFKAEPDLAIWRKLARHPSYRPHQKRKNAAAIRDAVKALPASPHYDDVFRATGLIYNLPCIVDGNQWYKPRLRYFNVSEKGAKLLLQVPWKDVDPEKLAKYNDDHSAGRTIGYSAETEYLLWVVPEAMKEIKEWEALKIIEEEAPKDAHRI